jgi:long-chain acyl-CoA synthetase
VSRTLTGAPLTVDALWREAEAARADRTAIVAGATRLTYGEAGARIRALARSLVERGGVKPGDVVALLAPNGAEFVIAYVAIVAAGAMVQPVDERLRADEVNAMLRDSGAAGLVVAASLASRVPGGLADLPAMRWMLAIPSDGGELPGAARWEDWAAPTPAAAALPPREPDDIAELMVTSGTAGEPKPVMRSHRNVRAAVRNSIVGFGYRAGDVILIAMPLSHSSALNSQMLPILELGGTLVIVERFAARAALETIRAEGVTCMRAVPSMIKALLTAPDFRAADLPSLRLIVNSSAAIEAATFVALKERFPGVEVMNSYGLTEASTCTVLPDAEALRRPASIGAAIRGVEMTLRDTEGREVATGDEGEIWVRGEHVFAAYRGRPGLRERTVRDGWLRTGDLAHVDADGYYYLHGRQDDVIDCGGRKFAPLEVEQIILELDTIAEAAVVGTPHRMLGQVAKAFVVPREGATIEPRAVIRHCQSRLASYKVPFAVDLVTALPRNSLGKLVRRRLTDDAAAAQSSRRTSS